MATLATAEQQSAQEHFGLWRFVCNEVVPYRDERRSSTVNVASPENGEPRGQQGDRQRSERDDRGEVGERHSEAER